MAPVHALVSLVGRSEAPLDGGLDGVAAMDYMSFQTVRRRIGDIAGTNSLPSHVTLLSSPALHLAFKRFAARPLRDGDVEELDPLGRGPRLPLTASSAWRRLEVGFRFVARTRAWRSLGVRLDVGGFAGFGSFGHLDSESGGWLRG